MFEDPNLTPVVIRSFLGVEVITMSFLQVTPHLGLEEKVYDAFKIKYKSHTHIYVCIYVYICINQSKYNVNTG
jgi:hypothetical protein